MLPDAERGLCQDCSPRELGYILLAVFVCLILLPILVAWSIVGFLLTRSTVLAVLVGWIVFVVLAIIAIALDPFEWGYIFGIGLDLFVVTIIVLGYDWPSKWKLARTLSLYTLLALALVLTVLSLTQYSQDGAVSGGLRRLDEVLTIYGDISRADLMDATNQGAIISGLLAVTWIVMCDQSLWLPANEDLLLESETRVLKTMCSKRVAQLVVEGLGTLIVTDEDLPGFDRNSSSSSPSSSSRGGESSAADGRTKSGGGGGGQGKSKKIEKQILVLVHGYASANCYWAPVLAALQERFQVYCVELIGWGRSDRVPWSSTTPDEVLSAYRDSIERWRRAMGLERFVLMGHSLGCHACAAYAIAYPHRVAHLFLASPAGVGMPPEALKPKLDQCALLDYEFDAPSETGASTLSNGSFRKKFQVSRFTFTFLSWVWESNLTPMDGIRWLGPFGHLAVAGTLERRANKCGPNSALRRLTPEQAQALIDFTYQNQASPPSGERALAPIFIPGAYAKKPLCLWLRGPLYHQRAALFSDQRSPPRAARGAHYDEDADVEGGESQDLLGSASMRGSGSVVEGSALSTSRLPPTPLSPRSRAEVKTIDCPVSIIYGSPDLDWMRSKYGADLCEQLRREGVDARLYQMKESGHIVYMEDPEDFVNCVLQAFFNRQNFHQVYRHS